MTDSEKREGARRFYQKWVGRGEEDKDSVLEKTAPCNCPVSLSSVSVPVSLPLRHP